MAWTPPRDWNTNEIVTETHMDNQIKGNMEYLKDEQDNLKRPYWKLIESYPLGSIDLTGNGATPWVILDDAGNGVRQSCTFLYFKGLALNDDEFIESGVAQLIAREATATQDFIWSLVCFDEMTGYLLVTDTMPVGAPPLLIGACHFGFYITSDGSIFCTRGNGVNDTQTDTGLNIPADATFSGHVLLMARVDWSVPSIDYYVNDTLVLSTTVHVPAAGDNLYLVMGGRDAKAAGGGRMRLTSFSVRTNEFTAL